MEGREAAKNATPAMTPLQSLFADEPEMRELILFFVDDLGRRVEAMRDALSKLDQPRLRTLAHQLSGSAAGYGYPAIGEAARLLESELKHKRSPTSAPSPHGDTCEQWSQAELNIAQLHQRTIELIDLCRSAMPSSEGNS